MSSSVKCKVVGVGVGIGNFLSDHSFMVKSCGWMVVGCGPWDYTVISWSSYMVNEELALFPSLSPSPVQVRKWAVWVMGEQSAIWCVSSWPYSHPYPHLQSKSGNEQFELWGEQSGIWWVACEIIMSSPGTGFPSPSPVPVPVAWQLFLKWALSKRLQGVSA